MLQVKNIRKEYKTGSFVQRALNDVSLNLRENEFVAILGPSGSGKTTLLNIIGGLDRYDSGDLIINGTSTKEYTDRDWDAYRNHSIGFIFQSYNLIPHQTILANVELALTIAGISKSERTRRASEALRRVGLADHMHKRPDQLSGGQMQRVAIARALVNEPDILLADEPTGALDSETSIQVMELLKEVAKDRLVVMVTHNPELARQYATRVVEVKDGRIIADSDPYILSPEDARITGTSRLGRASMSFMTALSLSFNNLRTKLKRTLLVSFAGSIGIIGIALILSLSNGMTQYIDTIQQETLSEYPIQLTGSSLDFTSITAGMAEGTRTEDVEVRERQIIANMFSTVSVNDLRALKDYFDSGDSGIENNIQALEYAYGVSPLIYADNLDDVRQVHPDSSFSALGFSGAQSAVFSNFSGFSGTDVFHAIPETGTLYLKQYDLKAGRWPESYNECILVLMSDGSVSDLTLYAMGIKDANVLDRMIEAFITGSPAEKTGPDGIYNYTDFIGITFRLVNRADLYAYDEGYGVWTDKSGDAAYMKNVVAESEKLTIVGVVQPKPDATSAMLNMGVNFPASLVYHVIEEAAASDIVKAQLDSPETDVITGRAFGDTDIQEVSALSGLFDVDAEAIQNAFSVDTSELSLDLSDFSEENMDLSGVIGTDDFAGVFPELSAEDIASIFGNVKIEFSLENMGKLFGDITEGYLTYAAEDPSTDYAKLPDAMQEYLSSDQARALITADIQEILSDNIEEIVTEERLQAFTDSVIEGLTEYLEGLELPDLDKVLTEYQTGELTWETLQEVFRDYLQMYLESAQLQAMIQGEVNDIIADITALTFTEENSQRLMQDLYDGYEAYAAENELPEASKMRESFEAYLDTPEAQAMISEGINSVVNTDELERQLSASMRSYSRRMESSLSRAMQRVMEKLSDTIAENMESAMNSLAENLPEAFSVDADAFADAIKMSMDGEELKSLMASLLSTDATSFENNLRSFGYANLAEPTAITIYPRNFDSKNEVLRILDEYNEEMREKGRDDLVIGYTDMVGTMMSSVTTIINTISYVLVAFVAISLVVSSIMIGVITYISVLERKKEIGILRAIGASKRNISEVFNAETVIIGALSGVIGIVLSVLILIPGNYIIHRLTGQPDLSAVLPVVSAFLLIVLSITLTLIGGLIPATKAAKSDPVTALRTE